MVGPITNLASTGISTGVLWAFGVAPWLAGAIMGGLWPVFLMFGLHWGFLPMKLPFYFGLVGGATGGAIAAWGGSASSTFVLPSLLALPAYLDHGSFTMQLIGTGVAIALAFTLTLFFGINKNNDEPDDVLDGAVAA
ncbi:MAG: hypothetical protein QM582_02075 [Micropruina sp.]|uniref:hypothetical protein n=1 Tax=Micropruina sp. TaxID=2737536 RepID=UPI0039E38403